MPQKSPDPLPREIIEQPSYTAQLKELKISYRALDCGLERLSVALARKPEIFPTPATDGLSAEVAAVGPLGTAKVSVTADADLGSGTKAIFGELDITVTQGEAVGFTIALSDPVEQ